MWELLHGQRAFTGHQLGFIVEHVALLGERPACGEGVPEDFRCARVRRYVVCCQCRPCCLLAAVPPCLFDTTACCAAACHFTRLLMEACWHADPAQRPRFTQVSPDGQRE